VKLRKKLGDQAGGQAKIWGGMAHPAPPLESPLVARTNGFDRFSDAFFQIAIFYLIVSIGTQGLYLNKGW